MHVSPPTSPSQRSGVKGSTRRLPRPNLLARFSARFWALASFLVFAFLVGGGSRPDIESLMVLRPVSAIVFAYALIGISRDDAKTYWLPLVIAGGALLLCAVQLVPLPPAIWQSLPGRDLIVEIDRAAGLGAIWRPINMAPSDGWNALFALLPPFATLGLAVQLRTDEKWALIPVLIGIALVSAVVAVLQLGGAPTGPLYFYRIVNYGEAVGLFANRNHQAVFLASILPMLAVAASADAPFSADKRLRGLLALIVGSFLVTLILVTGSRAGLVVGLLGLAGAAIFYGSMSRGRDARPVLRQNPKLWIAVLAIVVLCAIGATILLGRAVAIDRLLGASAADELRYRAWGPMWRMAMQYFPIGSGFGSFPDLYRVHESYELLAPTTFRHAHNDWLELLLTGGVPATLLLVLAIIAAMVAFVRSLRAKTVRVATLMTQMGLCVILMIAVASMVDYPLRVPSIACLFAVAVSWAGSVPSRLRAEKV